MSGKVQAAGDLVADLFSVLHDILPAPEYLLLEVSASSLSVFSTLDVPLEALSISFGDETGEGNVVESVAFEHAVEFTWAILTWMDLTGIIESGLVFEHTVGLVVDRCLSEVLGDLLVLEVVDDAVGE